MAELEKVINALECCLDINHEKYKHCLSCQYRDDIDHLQWACMTDGILEDALSLLKAQRPRVMTIKELEETGEPVFIELKTKGEDDKALACFGLLSKWDNLGFHFIIDQWLLDGEPFFKMYGCELNRKEYSIQWRPWNKRPTIKQMKASKWKELPKEAENADL